MTVNTLQANFTRGEVTPYMHARVDTEFYQAGMASASNLVIIRYGGVTRAPGSIFHYATKTQAKKSRMIAFEFNREQVYAIEAGDLYFRFHTAEGVVESSPGVPYEVVTPYLEADLPSLRARQSGDVVYLWCDGYQPRTLTRVSETNWTLATYVPIDGPYLPVNTTGTTLTPAETGHITPQMTANVTGGYTASDDTGHAWAYQLFDRDTSQAIELAADEDGWLQIVLPVAQVSDAYWLTAPKNASKNSDYITRWTFEGYDGAVWVVLDSRQSESGWTNGETRYYSFPNTTAYARYRLNFSGGGGDDATLSTMAELAINIAGDYQTPFNLTASSTTGINNNTGFQTSDVGRCIRLQGGDGLWRWARIAARTSTTVVTIRLYGHALPDVKPIKNWRLGAWSDYTGWPTSGAIYEDRMVHARNDNDPLGGWMSVNGDYDNFRVSTPVVDDDAVSFRLTGGKLNDIGWLNENRDLVAGTAGSLRAVGRNDPGKAISPSNLRQRTETITPSSDAEPINIENVVLFMDFFEQRLYEASYTYETEGYLAREVSTLNEHLFAAGVKQIVYMAVPHKLIVGRRLDGKLVFFTYDREQKVAGGTPIDFGGVVEDICTLPGVNGTDLWMTIKRTVNGSTVRYIERLAEFWRSEFTVQGQPVYAASALIYDGAATGTVTGLGHMTGESLGIWADGRDIGDATVVAGSLTLPYSIEASEIVVGKRMSARGQGLRLSQIGNQDGTGLGRAVNIVEASVDLYESYGLKIGGLSKTDLMVFEADAELDPDAAMPLKTGMFSFPVDDSWHNTGVYVFETDSMYPFTVRAVSLKVDGEP